MSEAKATEPGIKIEWHSESAYNNFAEVGYVMEQQAGTNYFKTYMCRSCGSLVYEKATHVRWHRDNDKPF